DLCALGGAGAVCKRDVVQAVGCLIETLVRTVKPAEGALGAKVKAHDRPLILRRAALKCLVSRLAFWPQLELAFDGGNSGAFHELEPLRQNRNFMRPFNSFASLHCPCRFAYFLVCLARGFCADGFIRILVA